MVAERNPYLPREGCAYGVVHSRGERHIEGNAPRRYDHASTVEEGILVTGSITQHRAKAGLLGAFADLAEREAFGEVSKNPYVQFRVRGGGVS